MPATVKGGVALRKALRNFAPDLGKETTKEIGTALKPIVKTARGYLPDNNEVLSGWLVRPNSMGKFPQYDVQVARRGVGYKTTPSRANRKGFRSLVQLFNKSRAGSIYEIAGRNKPESPFVVNQNAKFQAQMKGKNQMSGRALLRAYDENNGKARAAVLNAIQTAASKFKARTQV